MTFTPSSMRTGSRGTQHEYRPQTKIQEADRTTEESTSIFTVPMVIGDDILYLEEPHWLVDDVLVEGSLCFLYGPPAIGKSFAALDLAGSISAGIDWFGHGVTPGRAVYVIAEGFGGDFSKRVEAFMAARRLDSLPGIAYVPQAINLYDRLGLTGRAAGDEILTRWDPSLVVFDTLSRCSVGADENSARDMGIVVQTADFIRHESGATVLIVAHTGKDKKLLRGSSVLEGAADTTIKAKKDDNGDLILINEKQKSAAPFPDLRLRLVPSCRSLALGFGTKLSAGQLLGASLVPSGGITHSEWEEEFVKAGGSKGNFRHVRESLVEKGLVEPPGVHRGGLYLLADRGRELL